ncbi:GTPase HflX [Vallicoccus soli]|uniref:GTPase HflX n=1 Tax=Vallicoccus soli TaxID=2339232 RepID=A0A3A3YXE5_9ACTN|nr:GTPase HflX [Vallicoccus soli]RJK94938.1 GTPase HflX [Vallicoccus soli]
MAGAWLIGREDARRSRQAVDGERPRAVLLAVHRSDDRAPAGGRPLPVVGATGSPLSLDELERLADTDGIDVVDRVVQERGRPDPATYVGAGKADELGEVVRRTGADVVVADEELSPAQARNLEERAGVRVVDRTALILDIFREHARTAEGRTQVELAQIAYQLPRLLGHGREMSRVGGGRVAGGAGIGVRGPGEMRLEVERRRLRSRAGRLRRGVGQLAERRATTRRRRARNEVPGVALTGYTNAGKSALLNRLTGADVAVEGVLFATLDPTVRRLVVDGTTMTVADTVGFVRHLPHQLVDAFRSTLEEVAESDLAVHVVDASAPDAIDQLTTVRGVLAEVGAGDVPELLVLNKVDVTPADRLEGLQRAYPDALAVSALTGQGVPGLRQELAARLATAR